MGWIRIGNAIIGSTTIPLALFTAGIRDRSIGGTVRLNGYYYPSGNIDIHGNAEIRGSIATRFNIRIKGNARIIHDLNLGQGIDLSIDPTVTQPPPVPPGEWGFTEIKSVPGSWRRGN